MTERTEIERELSEVKSRLRVEKWLAYLAVMLSAISIGLVVL